MDIQKEREAFESWFKDHIADNTEFDRYSNEVDSPYFDGFVNATWMAWQTKAQAVPEVLKKFCNEHKDPAWRGCLTEYDKGYSDCCIAVLEMIEAQEPK